MSDLRSGTLSFWPTRKLPRVGYAIGLHDLVVGHLKAARDGVKVVSSVEEVFGHGGGGCAWLNS